MQNPVLHICGNIDQVNEMFSEISRESGKTVFVYEFFSSVVCLSPPCSTMEWFDPR